MVLKVTESTMVLCSGGEVGRGASSDGAVVINAPTVFPEHAGSHDTSAGEEVTYDFLSLACMSVLLEQNGEAVISKLQRKLQPLGIAYAQSEERIEGELLDRGLVESDGAVISITESGVNYVANRTDWVEGTYQSQGRKMQFGPTSYTYMSFFQEEAGPEGWIMDKLNTGVSPIAYTVEILDVTPGSAARKIGNLRSSGIVESMPEKPTPADPMRNLRLTRYGEAKLEAIRVMFAGRVYKLEHGSDDDLDLTKLPETDVRARISAVNEEIRRMCEEELGESHESNPEDIENLSKDAMLEMLDRLTSSMRELEQRIDNRR